MQFKTRVTSQSVHQFFIHIDLPDESPIANANRIALPCILFTEHFMIQGVLQIVMNRHNIFFSGEKLPKRIGADKSHGAVFGKDTNQLAIYRDILVRYISKIQKIPSFVLSHQIVQQSQSRCRMQHNNSVIGVVFQDIQCKTTILCKILQFFLERKLLFQMLLELICL